jgi:transcription antitermination factor NusG
MQLHTQTTNSDVASIFESAPLPWYAVRTKSNCEKPVVAALMGKGIEAFLPEYRVRRQSFGRIVTTEVPLFSGYLFCRFDASRRIPVISTPGLVSIVGFGNEPAPIPDEQIHAVQALLASGLRVEACGYLHEGLRVRIRKGPFQDVEGILVTRKSECTFIVSVPLLQRSVAVEVDPAWVTAA